MIIPTLNGRHRLFMKMIVSFVPDLRMIYRFTRLMMSRNRLFVRLTMTLLPLVKVTLPWTTRMNVASLAGQRVKRLMSQRVKRLMSGTILATRIFRKRFKLRLTVRVLKWDIIAEFGKLALCIPLK